MRLLVLPLATALLLALAACQGSAPTAPSGPTEGVCRIGPDDGPPLPLQGPAGERVADRGIGGTGISQDDGDRGIGGTGIVGVITGFASVCVNGVEVVVDPGLEADLDGTRGDTSQLRAGQVAVIEATGGSALRAKTLSIRHEVSGPVDSVSSTGLRVAGQQVVYAEGMRGGRAWTAGDWVTVSGLHQPDGSISATRIDRRQPGPVAVRGTVARDEAGLRVGGLRIRATGVVPVGTPQWLTGRIDGDVLMLERTTPDIVRTDPAQFFGTGIRRLMVEGFVLRSASGLQFDAGRFGASPQAPPGGARRVVLDLQRQPNGRFMATGLRPSGPGPGGMGAGPQRGGAPGLGPSGGGRPPGGPGSGPRPWGMQGMPGGGVPWGAGGGPGGGPGGFGGRGGPGP